MKTQSLTGVWGFRQSGKQEDWLPATVPGGVHTDLLALGKIPDPFFGDNEKKVQWVAQQDWEYHRSFSLDNEILQLPHLWLVCDGLDTLATVLINGQELGITNNMFRQYRWDVKSLLKNGENEILIKFTSPVQYAAKKQDERYLPGVPQAITGGPYVRKAPCHFGWDWGPQLPPIGIWKDIRLEGYEGARIDEVRFIQEHQPQQVSIQALVRVENWDSANSMVKLQISSPTGQVFECQADVPQTGEINLQITVSDPQIWWPNGYGDQPLYQASIILVQDGQLLDRKEFQLGLRTIELRQKPDEWGRSFTFVVNGLPIFAKGSDWIPADSFPTRITDTYLEGLIRSAVDTHQNMLRVWGGGFYEEDRFYDLCDRYGILIWQDFIFACSVYPLNDPEFIENLHVEATENIRRLRHRASLALWCGNNEMEQGWVDWGWKGPEYLDLKTAYDQFFHHTLPEWCRAEDSEHSYWPSSPSSDIPFEDPNGQQQGDAHYWDVWHGRKPFTAYRGVYPRFMSEFGFQSLPPMPTIRAYAQEPDWNMTSYIMERHQKNDSGNQLMVTQMLDTFRLPSDFTSLVYLSLCLQAEGIRYGVEHWRRHPRRVMGTLYWQLNDCWPVASWSSLDYYGRWKALHYAARRFYAPLMLSIQDEKFIQDIYITSELREPWVGYVHWSLETLAGQVLESGDVPVNVPPFEVISVCHHDFSSRLDDDAIRDTIFIAELWKEQALISRQTAYFVPTKHLDLAAPGINAVLQCEDDQLLIDITTVSTARLVEITLEGADVVFSDNYFDIPAGRKVTITVPLPKGWSLQQAKTALKVRSVYDSYAH